jgi:tRNA (guanine26-N2/guanine27-N2)-dimethyltransferase
MSLINESSAKINITTGKISKKLEVFYNPVMKLNRDVSILLLNCVPDKDMQIADPLAGTGVRSIRFAKELKKGKINNISVNDYSSAEKIEENLKLNNIDGNYISVHGKDANLFLLESKGFDYIDVDPFGTPNPFLEASILRLARGGILAVTATDTSALAGSSPTACRRKYWAKPLKNELMHELGIRILIRKAQLMGAQFEKALTPIFSYSKDHYYRIFFRCEKGRQKADLILKKHNYFLYNPKTMEMNVSEFNKEKDFVYAGPLWTGRLWDSELAEKMYDASDKENKELSFLEIIKEESKIDAVGFYDLQKLANIKNKPIPKVESILKKGVARTHFLGWGLRSSTAPF